MSEMTIRSVPDMSNESVLDAMLDWDGTHAQDAYRQEALRRMDDGWVSVEEQTPEQDQEVRIHYRLRRRGGDPSASDWHEDKYRTAVVYYHDGRWIGDGGVEPWAGWGNHEVTVLRWHSLPDTPTEPSEE